MIVIVIVIDIVIDIVHDEDHGCLVYHGNYAASLTKDVSEAC